MLKLYSKKNPGLRDVARIFRCVCIAVLSVLLLQGCLRERKPDIITNEASDVMGTTATCGGSIYDNGAAVYERGVCYDVKHKPEITGLHTTDGHGSGDFVSHLTGLEPNTTYYVRAYTVGEHSVFYGDEISFTTQDASHSPADLLTRPRGWKLSAATSSPAYQMADGSFVSDLMYEGYLYSCELDDIITFNADGSMLISPGTVFCEDFGYQYDVLSTWHFNADNTCLYFQIPFFYNEYYNSYDAEMECANIISLNDHELKLAFAFNDDDFPAKGTYTFHLTYVPIW